MPRFLQLCVCLCVIFASCRKENRTDCFKGNGDEKTEIRFPGTFRQVDVYDKIELEVIQGPECRVQVTAGEKLLRNIRTELQGDMLVIDNRNTCNFVRGYKHVIKVTVTMPYLLFLRNSGVGPATVSDNFRQDTLVVRTESSGDIFINGVYNEIRTSAHGNGDMYVKGRCNSFFIYSYGTNFVYADDLHVKDFMFVHSLTLGDCDVRGDSLEVFACNRESDGNINLGGQPKQVVDYTKEGVRGKLVRLP